MFARGPSNDKSAPAVPSPAAPSFAGYSDMWSSSLGAGTSSSSALSTSSSSAVKKSYAETEAFKRRRGTIVVAPASTGNGASSSEESAAACRWVWTDAGFGQIVADTAAQRDEQRAKDIALSFAPTAGESSSSAILAPSAQSGASILGGASSSGAPQLAPPSSSSPSTSLNQFLSLIGTPKAAGAAGAPAAPAAPAAPPAAPAAPSSYYSSYASVPAPPSVSATNVSAPATLALSLPVVPPIVVTAPPSCTDDHVAVHLLPHYACPTMPRANPLAASSGSSSASSASGARGGPLSMPDALVSFSALPATVIYTPAARAFSTVRLRIRTFFDVASLVPKKKETADDSSSGSSSKSFNQLLGAEIRARKEKAEKDKLVKDMSASAREAFEAQQAKQRKAEREAEEKKAAAADPSASKQSKPEGPPPQELTLDVAAGESLRGVVQRIVEFYATYGAEMDADSIRLVSNGVEITRPHTVVPSCGVVAPAGGAAASTPTANAAAAAASGEAMVPFSAILEGLSPSSPLLERLTKLLNISGGGAGASIAQAQISLANAQALLAAAKDNGGNLDSNTRKLLKTAMAQAIPDFGKRGAAVAAAAAAPKAAPPSLAERERFFRSHTMLAEAGLVPLRSAGVSSESKAAPAVVNDGSTMSPAAASSSPSTSDAALPIFPLLLIYDELSRFALDVSTIPPEITLSPDGLGLTMSLSDNKWLTVRAAAAFTSGKHSWKVRMDKCAGGNVFLGVCNANMKLNNYIGSDSNGWGYYGCGNIYRQGSSSSFGASYRTGDCITLKLDMDARSLSFDKNDQSLGVAFTDLPDAVFPAFSLYTKGDHIQISEFGTW